GLYRFSHRTAAASGHCHLHTRLDAQIFGDASQNGAEIVRRGIAVAPEHTVKGFFAQAGLPRQFFETDFGVHQVASMDKPTAVSPSKKQLTASAESARANFGSRFIRAMMVSLWGSCRNHFTVSFAYIVSIVQPPPRCRRPGVVCCRRQAG
ncbi:MAG: hypothetical protein ACREFR_03285, partial [Limisphaerales bacterium]